MPSLLCEDAESVASFWRNLPDVQRPMVNKWVADSIHAAQTEGFDIGSIRERLFSYDIIYIMRMSS